jgi:hypothetical protein
MSGQSNAHLPDLLAAALSRLQAGHITPADIESATAAPLPTGLTPQELYVLVCFQRHERRQQWVGFLVESRLSTDGEALGRMGAFGRSEDVPQKGDIPGEPGWRYYFHGRGCCFTHADGTSIDVDFGDDGSAVEIDPYFYTNFLESLRQPEWCEAQLKRPKGFDNAWQFEMVRLAALGLITRKHRFRLTESGRALAESIAPLLEAMNTADRPTRCWISCLVGDYDGAVEEAAHQSITPSERLIEAANLQREQRRATLLAALEQPDQRQAGFAIAALGWMGPKYAFSTARRLLLRQPVSYLNHQTLAVVDHWSGHEVNACLLETLQACTQLPLLDRLSAAFKTKSSDKDRSRLALIASLAESLLRRLEPDQVDKETRMFLKEALRTDCYASDEMAGFLLYLLSAEEGLAKLARNLASTVPICREGAACFLALIADKAALDALIRVAEATVENGGHEAACALSFMEDERAKTVAQNWSRRHDGYEDAEGEVTEIFSQKRRVWRMEEIMRSNMRAQMLYHYEGFRERFQPLLTKWRPARS